MTKPYGDVLLTGEEPGSARDVAARRERAARRDSFAAAALAGMMADDDLTAAISVEDLARRAWAFADAMLAADPEARP